MSGADPVVSVSAPPASTDPLGDRLMALVWRKPAENVAERRGAASPRG